MRSRPSRRSPRGRRSSGCRPTAACRTIFRTRPRRRGSTSSAFQPRFSYLPFEPFGSRWYAAAIEPGVEGWVQYYMHPETAVARRPQGVAPAARDRARTGDPVSRRDGGRGRDQSGCHGESLEVHLHLRGRGRRLGLRGARGGPQRGLSPPALLERQYVASQPRATTPIRASSACPSSSTERRLRAASRARVTLRGFRVPAILGA